MLATATVGVEIRKSMSPVKSPVAAYASPR
jgi:hypothetical protein